MAKYVSKGGKDFEQEEEGKSLQVEYWVDKDGKITVNESSQLGTKKMPKLNDLEPQVFECIGVYGRPASKVRATFTLESLGTVTDKQVVAEGEAVEDSPKFDALPFLDEPEKLGALNDADKRTLQSITIGELRAITVKAVEFGPHPWTPLENAAAAILAHQEEGNSHFPQVTKSMPMKTVKGDHADGAKATLTVGTHTLTVGDEYFKFVGYSFCKGQDKYSFTWEDVPVTYLDEPAK